MALIVILIAVKLYGTGLKVKVKQAWVPSFSLSDAASVWFIAANPPEFFVIIRKSKLEIEYEFPKDEFCFRILKILLFFFFFPLCSIDDTVRPPAAINIHAHSLCMCAIFFSFRGNAPPPEEENADLNPTASRL